MKKLVLAAVMAAFAAASMSVPADAAKKKDQPGKCGTMKYFDKKSKACKSKG